MNKIKGMKPQSKLWKLIPQQSCGVLNHPPSAGLFDLQISMHYVFEIWVSRINLKLSILSVLFILQVIYINAQSTDRENIKALKVAFITEQLTLTTNEAEKFWPIYNYYSGKEYTLKIVETRKLRHQIKAKGGIDAISDNEADLILKRLLEIDNEISFTKNEMNQKLKSVLNSKKLIKLQIAEFEFNRKVLEELRKKKMERFKINQ